MSKFHDGPANGQTLLLGRAPRFLRVVETAGKFDALDQLTDEPTEQEAIHVYEIQTEPIVAFVDGTDPVTGRRFGRRVEIADYAWMPDQPADHDVRTTEAWQAWVTATAARLDAE